MKTNNTKVTELARRIAIGLWEGSLVLKETGGDCHKSSSGAGECHGSASKNSSSRKSVANDCHAPAKKGSGCHGR